MKERRKWLVPAGGGKEEVGEECICRGGWRASSQKLSSKIVDIRKGNEKTESEMGFKFFTLPVS
jgi:hypothetical protein